MSTPVLRSDFDGDIQRVIDELQRFVVPSDLELHLSITLEYALRSHARLLLTQLDRTKTAVHPYRLESLPSERRWLPPVEFLADVDVTPEAKLLKRFGIDEPRTGVVFHVSTAWLQSVELVPRVGDLVIYEGIEYEIMNVNRQNDVYAANFNVPLYFQLYAERFRHGE